MQAGKLRHRITLQQLNDGVQDQETGDLVQQWEDWATVYASVEPLSARELIAAQGVKSEVTARIVIRHKAGVHAGMRILHRGGVYSIAGVLPDPKTGREYLTLPVAEGLKDE